MLVVKPNPEGAKGKKKARIVVCGNFQTVHQDEMTSSKILHCMHENSFVNESQTVTLKPSFRPPEVDERLSDECLPEVVKRKHVSGCQRYIGQLMWLATRTRPDISAILGICAP